ncbi:MAG: CoA pyrophosphatase [Gammaproteobacteria bacterium]|nr:MAG: CoA pyrophosphatase [Gammaproteobacteria bacterium]
MADLRLVTIRDILASYEHERVAREKVSRRAAVATILRGQGDDTEVLLIRRSERPHDPWSGHMAFPGGHVEPGEGMLEAARRETREEIGLDLDAHGRLIGRLDHTHAVARGRRLDLLIAPYVFELSAGPAGFELNHEVSEVVWAPLRPMLLGNAHTVLEYELDGEKRRFPGYDVDGRVVWGLTYRMLGNLFALLHPEWEPIDL